MISNTQQKVSNKYRDNPFWDKDISPRVVEATMSNGRLTVDLTSPYPQHVCKMLSEAALLLECALEEDFSPTMEWADMAEDLIDEIRKDLAI